MLGFMFPFSQNTTFVSIYLMTPILLIDDCNLLCIHEIWVLEKINVYA